MSRTKWGWIAVGAGLTAGAALLAGGSPEMVEVSGVIASDDGRPFGPYHREKRPPGWPLFTAVARDGTDTARGDGLNPPQAMRFARAAFTARHRRPPATVGPRSVPPVSVRGAALPWVRRIAAETGLGERFVKTMVHLALREGEGGCFGVPARNFDSRNRELRDVIGGRRLSTGFDGERPRNRALITAAGVFQWNRDAGREAGSLANIGIAGPELHADWMPWDWSPNEELTIPIGHYARIWRAVIQRGGAPLEAARGVRLWHTGPSRFRRFFEMGATNEAWRRQPAHVAARIDLHLREAGVT